MSVEHIKMDTEISDEVVGEGWKGKFKKLLLMSNFLLGICTIYIPKLSGKLKPRFLSSSSRVKLLMYKYL